MKLHKFLLTPPIVAISAALFCGALFAEGENTFEGTVDSDWSNGENWSLGHVPQAGETVVIDGKTVEAKQTIAVASLSLKDATLKIGDASTRQCFGGDGSAIVVANVSGNLTLGGSSKLYVYSDELFVTNVFDTAYQDSSAAIRQMWTERHIVQVGGAFSVGGTSVVYPDFAPKTATPVVFTARTFELGEAAMIDCRQIGWGWVNQSFDVAPAGAKPRKKEGYEAQGWTWAFGSGCSYGCGGGYGGKGGNAGNQTLGGVTRPYGGTYGYSFAPFLSGAPAGWYVEFAHCRGSSAAVVYASEGMTLEGTVDACGLRYKDEHGAPSGGGIWLTTGGEIVFGKNAKLLAEGVNTRANSYDGAGGGGRIALGEEITPEAWETLAGGTVPEGYVEAPTISECTASAVSGPRYEGKAANQGTLAFVRSTTAKVPFFVDLAGEGFVELDGVAYDASFSVKVKPGSELTLTATAAEGSDFLVWSGDLLQGGVAFDPAVTVTVPESRRLTVAFVSQTVTPHVWTGASSKRWTDVGNWSPATLPGPNDDVTIGSGTVEADIPVSVASLTLTGGATLDIGGRLSRNSYSLATTGDLTVSGGAKLRVYALELADRSVFANVDADIAPLAAALWDAAKVVSVGGDFVVEGANSSVRPDAAPVTGVPVVFRVGRDFTLGEGAKFDAVEAGWGWTPGTDVPTGGRVSSGNKTGWTYAPGSGRDYMHGGGYGGAAASPDSYKGMKFGSAYGYAMAPFLPGSCSGWYAVGQESISSCRGAGSVVVFTKGTATVNGTINASSTYHDHSSASGGGIWLTAETFSFGENASLSAHGGYTVGYKGQGLGGGGRIALAEGYSDADIETAATGVVPEDFKDYGAIESVAVDVAGGIYTGTDQAYWPKAGTVSYVKLAALPVKLTVAVEGEGSVTFGGQVISETTDLTVPVNTDLSFAATAAAGSSFISWGGDCLPDGVWLEPNLTINIDIPRVITVTFVKGTVTRTWVGGKEGEWAQAPNWLPAGVPSVGNEVIIADAKVSTAGPIYVGRLVLSGSAQLTCQARAIEGGGDEALYRGATVITVAEELRLEDTAKLVPVNDPVTGAAIRYDVGGLYVGEKASIDATGTGWHWFESSDDEYATRTQGAYQTRSPGAAWHTAKGSLHVVGSGYGADGKGEAAYLGHAYGNKYAPFLPGAPAGVFSYSLGNGKRAGGTVWVKCSGLCEILGTIASDGLEGSYGASTGGGIWICTKGFHAAPSAKFTAVGGTINQPGNAYSSYASGGRASIAVGLTDAELDALALGEEVPAGLTCRDSLDGIVACDLRGSFQRSSVPTRGNPGTATLVVGPQADGFVFVTGSPVGAIGVEPDVGAWTFAAGTTQTFSVPAFGVDPTGAAVRYACAGYVVSNALGEVAADAGNTVDVKMENGPISVTWLWEAAQKRALVRKPEHGTLLLDGVQQDGDAEQWTLSQTVAVEVVPDAGYEFVCWEGVLPLGCAAENPLVATLESPLDVTPVLREVAEPTVRTWKGTGDWKDASKWTPNGIPGTGDEIVIADGTCTVSNFLGAAALQVTGGTLAVGMAGKVNGEIAVAGDAALSGGTLKLGYGVRYSNLDPLVYSSTKRMPGHARLSVGGNLTMGEKARAEVSGGILDASHTLATGSSFVEVAGTLALEGTSVLELYSDVLSGGSVKVSADVFTVAEGATVNAKAKGYMWLNGEPPDVKGLGVDYSKGASHGGQGAGNKSGTTYGFELAPIEPGASNGSYAGGQRPGGGVIRVHARAMTVNGTLNADACETSGYGGAAGGSIWLTAKEFAFGANAALTVRGGKNTTNYGSYGAGGRISICRNADEARLTTLAETGTWPSIRARRIQDEAAFRAAIGNETMTIAIGSYLGTAASLDGSFTAVDGTRPGMMLLVR